MKPASIGASRSVSASTRSISGNSMILMSLLQYLTQRFQRNVGSADHHGDVLGFQTAGHPLTGGERNAGRTFEQLMMRSHEPTHRHRDLGLAHIDPSVDQAAARLEGDGALLDTTGGSSAVRVIL